MSEPRPSTLQTLRLMFFCRMHMQGECRELNSFVTSNIAKSILISNAFVFCLYAARFKTYRNSHLLKANVLATYFGIHNGVVGVEPVFYSYWFNRSELVPGLLE
jgi:hypothetical protein